jgi:hypothetical protein
MMLSLLSIAICLFALLLPKHAFSRSGTNRRISVSGYTGVGDI